MVDRELDCSLEYEVFLPPLHVPSQRHIFILPVCDGA
jgi:hypothetical protein